MDQFSADDLKISSSCRMLVISPPQMGKSHFCRQLLANRKRIFQSHHSKLIYCSPHFAENGSTVKDQEFVLRLKEAAGQTPLILLDHMITWDELALELPGQEAVLIFVDDLAIEASQSESTHALFTRLSSHQNCDVVMTCHSGNYQQNGKYFSSIFSSCNYLCLMRNLADALSMSRLSVKMFPGQGNLVSRMMSAVNDRFGIHGHLLLDFSASSKINHRYLARSNIFEDQEPPYVLLFKNPIM